MIIVKVADTNRFDLLETDPPHRARRQRDPIAGGQQGQNPGLFAMEAAAKRRVADQARVETGIEQQPPAVDLNRQPWDRLDEPLLGRRTVTDHRFGRSSQPRVTSTTRLTPVAAMALS